MPLKLLGMNRVKQLQPFFSPNIFTSNGVSVCVLFGAHCDKCSVYLYGNCNTIMWLL